jgi:hypothetical protein
MLTSVNAQPTRKIVIDMALNTRHYKQLFFVYKNIANKLGSANIFSGITASFCFPCEVGYR